jgi:hypothetical protein
LVFLGCAPGIVICRPRLSGLVAVPGNPETGRGALSWTRLASEQAPRPMLDDYAGRVLEGVVWVLEEGAAIAGIIVLLPMAFGLR